MGFAHRSKGVAMKRSRTQTPQCVHVLRSGITLVLREAVAGVSGVEFFETGVAMSFGEDGGGGNGDAASVAFDQGFLFDEDVELHGVDQ